MKIIFLILSLLFAFATARSGCICPAVYSPVCSASGKTYSNRCQLQCARAPFKHNGSCRKH